MSRTSGHVLTDEICFSYLERGLTKGHTRQIVLISDYRLQKRVFLM